MHQGQNYQQIVLEKIKNGITEAGDKQDIHVIWYCISITTRRIEDIDIEILKAFARDSKIREKVGIVFTKCDEDEDDGSIANRFREVLKEECGYEFPAFDTSTDKDFKDPLQISELISWSATAITDEDLRKMFVGSQMQDLELKHKEVEKIILASSLGAGAIGASPIPFSDAVLLVPVQVKMIGKIIDIYGISNLASLSNRLIFDLVVTHLGKLAVANLVKLIPAVGNITGPAINATVATTLTGAIGKAISEISYKNVKAYLNGKEVMWEKIFIPEEVFELVKIYLQTKDKTV